VGIQSLKVGSSTSARYLAVGDDSVFNGAIVYGFAIFRRTRLKRLVQGVKDVKQRFGIPADIDIHCKDFRLACSRSKLGIEHLSDVDVENVYRNVVTLINNCDVLVKYGLAYEDKVRGFWSEGTITLEGGDSPVEVPVRYDPKGILGVLAQTCFASAPGAGHGPSVEELEIFIAPDSTKVKFLGGARQAHNWARGFSDMGTGIVHEVTPNIGGCAKELFEIADVIAYMCSHAAHGKAAQPFFYGLLSSVKSKVRNEFITDGI